MTTPKVKRLFFDIETSPNIGFFWQSGYRLNVPYDNIISERGIICICYKWAGESKIHHLTWDKKQSDKDMLKKFIKVMNEADEVVTHNGDRFDITWLRTRCIKHGIPMMPTYTSMDTYKAAKNKFRFNSNRLDYISRFLDVGTKAATGGFDLWKEIVLNKSASAMKKMVDYCKHDVVLLERIWDKMNTHLVAKTNVANRTDKCPECGSSHTLVNRRSVTAAGYKRVTFQCQDCGKYHSITTSRFEAKKQI